MRAFEFQESTGGHTEVRGSVACLKCSTFSKRQANVTKRDRVVEVLRRVYVQSVPFLLVANHDDDNDQANQA